MTKKGKKPTKRNQGKFIKNLPAEHLGRAGKESGNDWRSSTLLLALASFPVAQRCVQQRAIRATAFLDGVIWIRLFMSEGVSGRQVVYVLLLLPEKSWSESLLNSCVCCRLCFPQFLQYACLLMLLLFFFSLFLKFYNFTRTFFISWVLFLISFSVLLLSSFRLNY